MTELIFEGFLCKKHKDEYEKQYQGKTIHSVEARLFYVKKSCKICNESAIVWLKIK